MSIMKEVAAFLQHCKTFYLATMDGDKPQVRPFGVLCEFEDKLYLITTNKKAVYRQMKQNPNVAICGMYEDKWIRISGQVEEDTRREARVAMMETNKEVLSKMYSVDDQLMTVFRFINGQGTIYSFTAEPVTYSL